MSLRYLTAGESHGQSLMAIVEGFPAGVRIDSDRVNHELARRQQGYGRGGRMKIEKDQAKFLSGMHFGKTIGSPIGLLIENKDWENWKGIMSPLPILNPQKERMTKPRPGHADLSGLIKYRLDDLREVLERASARETAARVAVGALCKSLLEECLIRIYSHVVQIGEVKAHTLSKDPSQIWLIAEKSPVRCADPEAGEKMIQAIDEAKKNGDSLGGIFEVIVTGTPIGLGSYVAYDKRLDGRLAQSLMSIPAIKGVQFGMGFEAASSPGSSVHDEIFYDPQKGFYRTTNRAGGIEGGMSNGESICLQAAMKPIPTLYRPLQSVDIVTKEPFEASVERSDTCAVPAASVIGEAAVAFEITKALMERYGGDTLEQIKRAWKEDIDYLNSFSIVTLRG